MVKIDSEMEHLELPTEETVKGLMGRIGKGSHGWTSRDYNIDVPCNRITCQANSGVKMPSAKTTICMMPSAIKINAAGICATGQKLIDEQEPPTPMKVDGD